ncbi:MAG: hypothetical protein ACKV2V_17305 [Blastocatellia bacterium]
MADLLFKGRSRLLPGQRLICRDGNVLFVWDVDQGKELKVIDISTPDEKARVESLKLLDGAPADDDLFRIAHRELHTCDLP